MTFTRKDTDHVYILTWKCYRVWHTHLRKMLYVYNLWEKSYPDGKKPGRQRKILDNCKNNSQLTKWMDNCKIHREQRNHDLKYESDCVRIGIGIKLFMNRGRICERSFCWVFVIHTTIERKHSFCFRTSFHSRCVSYENCKCPRRNYSPKRENSFAILISACSFHISLQFSRFGV